MTTRDVPAVREAMAAITDLPCDAEGPVFGAPWEAQAFAMTMALHARGLFTWPECVKGRPLRATQGRPS